MRFSVALSLLCGFCPSLSMAKAKAADLPKLYWYEYTVDSASLQGYSKVRFDSKDSIKLAYRGPEKSIRYVELSHHRFAIQKVDAVAGSESKLDLALDASGTPHLYYQSSDNTRFIYATTLGSKWTLKDLFTQAAPNLDYYMVGVKADSKGDLHFAQSIFKGENNCMSYIHLSKEGKSTGPAFIDTTGRNGKWGSFALDSAEVPAAAYFDFNGGNLTFARKAGDTWSRKIIDSAQFDTKKGKFTTLRQGSGKFLITTLSEARKKIILISGKDTSWTIENIDDFPLFTTFSTLMPMALGKDGTMHIAYPRVKTAEEFTATTSGLVLARKSDSGWVMETVDAGENVGEYADMDIGPSGRIAISYFNRKNFTVKLLVSSLTAPPDADNDGIPDYKQVVSIRKKKVVSLGRKASSDRTLIDARGRELAPTVPAAAKAPKKAAAGVYFPSEK